MVGHGNQGKGAGSGMVGQSGDINQKLMAGSAYCELPAESAGMWYGYIINRLYHAWSSESDSQVWQNIGMQNIICRNDRLVVNISNIRLDYNDWAYNDSYAVCNVSVNGASMIHSLSHSAIKQLRSHILTRWMRWTFFCLNGQVKRCLPYPRNERQRSVNNFLSCMLENPNTGQLLSLIIRVLAAVLGKSARGDIATIS